MVGMSKNKKRGKLYKAFIQLYLTGPEQLVFGPSDKVLGQEVTVDFVIDEYFDENVEQSIVFGGEVLLPKTE